MPTRSFDVVIIGDGWIGFNLLPDQAADKIKRIEELLQADGRSRSDVRLAVSFRPTPTRSRRTT